MYVVYIHYRIVYNTNQIFLCKSLLFSCTVSPFLLHLEFDAIQHTSQQFCRVHVLLHLLIADVEQHVDALDCDYCIFLFEISPRNIDVYSFNMTEFKRKRQSQFIDKGRFK